MVEYEEWSLLLLATIVTILVPIWMKRYHLMSKVCDAHDEKQPGHLNTFVDLDKA